MAFFFSKMNKRWVERATLTTIPPIPWSVNPFLQYKSSIFGNVNCLMMYIFHICRFMSRALSKNRLILRPYNSNFLLTTTSIIPS